MSTPRDPDLPGDEGFRPSSPVVIHHIDLGPGLPPAQAMAMTIGPEAQAAVHHNRLRYAELQLLRMGQPNRYAETRYRHA